MADLKQTFMRRLLKCKFKILKAYSNQATIGFVWFLFSVKRICKQVQVSTFAIYSFIIHVDIVSDGARTIKLKAVADAKLRFGKQRRERFNSTIIYVTV